jgi:hypothetical protein
MVDVQSKRKVLTGLRCDVPRQALRQAISPFSKKATLTPGTL